jgi:hypothetical protein
MASVPFQSMKVAQIPEWALSTPGSTRGGGGGCGGGALRGWGGETPILFPQGHF